MDSFTGCLVEYLIHFKQASCLSATCLINPPAIALVAQSAKIQGDLNARWTQLQAVNSRTDTNNEFNQNLGGRTNHCISSFLTLLFRFEEISVRVTYRSHNVLSIVEKLCGWISSNENQILNV